jgi:hypothetical protein
MCPLCDAYNAIWLKLEQHGIRPLHYKQKDNDAVGREAAASKNAHGRLRHAREKIFLLLLASSSNFNMWIRRHHHRAILHSREEERRRRGAAAHHNLDIIIERFECGGDNKLEHKHAGRFYGRIWLHYQLW